MVYVVTDPPSRGHDDDDDSLDNLDSLDSLDSEDELCSTTDARLEIMYAQRLAEALRVRRQARQSGEGAPLVVARA